MEFREYYDSIKHDFSKKICLEKCIEQGMVEAYNWLGLIYDKGQEVPKDQRKAKELYEIGASKGCTYCTNNLGIMYECGVYELNGGVICQRDLEKAQELYEKALENGNNSALDDLVLLYKKKPFDRSRLYNYLLQNGKEDKMAVFGYSQAEINTIKEYKRLKEENERLMAHILASPDGPLYLEALEDWKTHSSSK